MNRTTPLPTAILRTAVIAIMAFATPLALSACSDQPSSTAADAASSGLGAKWGSCMRDAGFDVEDPADEQVASGAVISPPGVDRERYTQTAQACNEDLGIAGVDTASQDKWTREYAAVDSCIREQYPDAPEQEPGSLNYSDYALTDDPAFEKVFSDCLAKHSPDTQSAGF